ncbi:MAG: DNA (cytosine-5-)-methyltransferase [Acidobacteriaceae bacterium]
MFAEIDPFCCWLLRSRYGASRPIHMPSPLDAASRKEAKQRAAAIRNIIALPADGVIVNAGDFTKIGKQDVGTVDLLAGGTPCQSFSIAGKRAGLDDLRGNLTIEFARLADRLRPTWLVWENVPGVLSIDGGRTFGAFLGLLVELGYGIAYRILDARYFGVPQRRRRVFVVGYLGDWRAAGAVFLEFAGLSGHPPPRSKTRQGAAGGVEVGAAGGRFTDTSPAIDAGCKDSFVRNQLGVGVLSSTGETSHCLNAGGMGRQDFQTETLIAHALSADGFDASEDGTGRGTPLVPIAICMAHTQSNGSGFSADIAHTLESSAAQAVAFSAKDYGADAGDVAPTLRGMGHNVSHANGGGQVAIAFAQNQEGDVRSGAIMHSLGTSQNGTGRNAPTVAFTLHGSDGTASTASPTDTAGSVRTKAPGSIENSSTTVAQQGMAVRRLTPRECERLQGFPDDYTLVEYRGRLASDGPRYRALGNSMAVPVMRWIGERISAVDAILRDESVTGRAR